jgi:NhaP-type Na+/H+ or K+/H+ antiporter
MSTDQKRAIVILAVIAVLIAVVVIGVFWIAVSVGLPWWLALVISVVLAAAVGLFMIINLA